MTHHCFIAGLQLAGNSGDRLLWFDISQWPKRWWIMAEPS